MSLFLIQLTVINRRGGDMFMFIRTHLNIYIRVGLFVNKYIRALLLCGLIGGDRDKDR